MGVTGYAVQDGGWVKALMFASFPIAGYLWQVNIEKGVGGVGGRC